MREDRKVCTELMDRAASGDDGAFGKLAMAAQDDLYRFALAHGLGSADAAETTQETFLRAYRARTAWRRGSDVSGWLYGIAMNVIRECHRRLGRRGADGVDLDNLAGDDCGPPGVVGLGAGGGQPSSESDQAARRELLAKALASLPPRQQEAVSCRYLLQMSLRETAELMGCAEGTVKAAVFAALENLRKIIRKEPD
ncbi:MAG: RNA polymerase sigma factor [Phycisphaerae bacterium]